MKSLRIWTSSGDAKGDSDSFRASLMRKSLRIMSSVCFIPQQYAILSSVLQYFFRHYKVISYILLQKYRV